MSAEEAVKLIESKNGRLCARIYQRADGTMLTEDCPVGVARHWRRVKIVVVGVMTGAILAIANLTAFARNNNTPSSQRPMHRLTLAVENTVYRVKGWFGLNPPPATGKVFMMGVISVPPGTLPPKPVPSPIVLTGRISSISKTNVTVHPSRPLQPKN